MLKPMTEAEIKAAMKEIDPQLLNIDKQTFTWAVRYMEQQFNKILAEHSSTQLQG